MRRALTVIIAFHWAAILCVVSLVRAESGLLANGASLTDMALPIIAVAAQFLAALAFFWAFVSVLLQSDSEAAGQGDVCKIAIGAGLIATTIGALTSFADITALQLYALQFAALLVSHLIMQSERAVSPQMVGANDNSRASARRLAILAATNARLSRMTRQAMRGDHMR